MSEVIQNTVLLTVWLIMIVVFSFPEHTGRWLAAVDQGRYGDACWVEYEHDYTLDL